MENLPKRQPRGNRYGGTPNYMKALTPTREQKKNTVKRVIKLLYVFGNLCQKEQTSLDIMPANDQKTSCVLVSRRIHT